MGSIPIPDNDADPRRDVIVKDQRPKLLEALGYVMYDIANDPDEYANFRKEPRSYLVTKVKDGENSDSVADLEGILHPFEIHVLRDVWHTRGVEGMDGFKVTGGDFHIIVPARTMQPASMSPADWQDYLRELGLKMMCGCSWPRRSRG